MDEKACCIFSYLRMAVGVLQISAQSREWLYPVAKGEAPMRSVLCSTALALLSVVSRAYAGAVVSMPEPSSPSLLWVDLLAVGVLVLLLRRRISSRITK